MTCFGKFCIFSKKCQKLLPMTSNDPLPICISMYQAGIAWKPGELAGLSPPLSARPRALALCAAMRWSDLVATLLCRRSQSRTQQLEMRQSGAGSPDYVAGPWQVRRWCERNSKQVRDPPITSLSIVGE